MKDRLLTVGAANYDHDLTTEKVPYIRLSGKWLEAAGFKVGDLISVELQDNGLLIRKMDGLQLLADTRRNITGPTGKELMRAIAKGIETKLPVKGNTH